MKDKDGNNVWEFYGTWNKELFIKNIETGEERLIWEINPRMEFWDHLYHLSLFGLQLNYLDEDLARLLPPTDSRFRTDQRALENGDLDAANREKHEIETSQRAIRAEWEKEGREFKPKYFEPYEDEDTKETCYSFNHLYWQDREAGDWSRIEKMW